MNHSRLSPSHVEGLPSDSILHDVQAPMQPPGGSPSPTSSPKILEIDNAKGRTRSKRKDRHSKIFTAQGPRDRRMRLSLDVARRFFDLQDMLGFDKASSTVDWLIDKSGQAIGNLIPPESDLKKEPTSEGETNSLRTSEKFTSTARKAQPLPSLARECRILARARARERTREKKLMEIAADVGQLSSSIAGGSRHVSSLDDISKDNHDAEAPVTASFQWGAQSSGNVEDLRLILPEHQIEYRCWDPFNESI